MSAPKPAFRPRIGGGFNQGMGKFGEHLDEDAVQQAFAQKQTNQQAAATGQSKPSQGTSAQQQAQIQQQPSPPREVGTMAEEAQRFATDVWSQTQQFFQINTWLGFTPQTMTPEEQQKAVQVHQEFNNLTQKQQEVAQKNYQLEMERKKNIEEENQQKEEQRRQAEAQPIQAPSSPRKGPVGLMGTKKQKSVQRLNQDRKMLSNAKGAN